MKDHIAAHKHSSRHRAKLVDDTAVCPYCGIDSVIGESSGYPVTKEFLRKMKKYWFLGV